MERGWDFFAPLADFLAVLRFVALPFADRADAGTAGAALLLARAAARGGATLANALAPIAKSMSGVPSAFVTLSPSDRFTPFSISKRSYRAAPSGAAE